jgi:hypothetical protein
VGKPQGYRHKARRAKEYVGIYTEKSGKRAALEHNSEIGPPDSVAFYGYDQPQQDAEPLSQTGGGGHSFDFQAEAEHECDACHDIRYICEQCHPHRGA